MHFLRIALSITLLGYAMLANASQNLYMPPAQISCYTTPYGGSDGTLNHCEGFDTSFLTVANRDGNIPRTPVVLKFTSGTADYYGHPEFFYNDTHMHYVSILGPANFSILAKVDDPAWVKKGERYYCVSTVGQCPIYLS